MTRTYVWPRTLGVGGGAVQMYNPTAGQLLAVAKGTAAAPDTVTQPLAKVERTFSVAAAAVTGDGFENLSSILGMSSATAASETQAVGVAGAAKTAAVAGAGNDACGIYGVGNVVGAGTGTGIGGFFNGRREINTGLCNGIEVVADNETVTAGTYLPTGFSDTIGVWLHASGLADSAVGIQVNNPHGRQFAVGLGFGSQVNGGKTGGVSGQSVRDDSAAPTSIQINGTHSVAALAVGAGSGKVVIGATAGVVSGSLLEVLGIDAFTDPLVMFGSTTRTRQYSLRIRNAVGQSIYGICANANEIFTGTIAGDAGAGATTTGKTFHIGGTVSTIAVGRDNTLGFFNHTKAAQATVTGSRGANAALASLLTALAAHGLIVDSSS